jgi:hypothetical protein
VKSPTIASHRKKAPIGRRKHTARSSGDEPDRCNEKIDESLQESFPASDPPSCTVLTRIGAPRPASKQIFLPQAGHAKEPKI